MRTEQCADGNKRYYSWLLVYNLDGQLQRRSWVVKSHTTQRNWKSELGIHWNDGILVISHSGLRRNSSSTDVKEIICKKELLSNNVKEMTSIYGAVTWTIQSNRRSNCAPCTGSVRMLENMASVPMVVTSHAQMSLLYLRRDRYPRDPEVERVRWILLGWYRVPVLNRGSSALCLQKSSSFHQRHVAHVYAMIRCRRWMVWCWPR